MGMGVSEGTPDADTRDGWSAQVDAALVYLATMVES